MGQEPFIASDWPELVIPEPAQAEAAARAYYQRWQADLNEFKRRGVDFSSLRGLINPAVQLGYRAAVYIWWLAHHWQQGTLHDTFWLPYDAILVGQNGVRPKLALAHYLERVPEAHGTDWHEEVALFVTDDPTRICPVLKSLGDQAIEILAAELICTDEQLVVQYRFRDGSPQNMPAMTDYAMSRPQQGGQMVRHIHPGPTWLDLCLEAKLPPFLEVPRSS